MFDRRSVLSGSAAFPLLGIAVGLVLAPKAMAQQGPEAGPPRVRPFRSGRASW